MATQQQPRRVQLGASGAQGGGSVGFTPLQTPQASSGTTDLLLQLGGKVLDQKVQEAQTKAYFDGAARVAQGESLGEVLDEQPWYTKIFGPSASAQGARSMAAVKQVDEFTNSLFNNMTELSQLSMDEISDRVNSELAAHLTGDVETDVIIQQKMVESSGQFFRAHAKEHVKFVQTAMQTEKTGALIESSRVLKSMANQFATGTLSEQDWSLAQANLASSILPTSGQSPASFWAAVSSAAEDSMANHNFHFMNLLEESGILDQMPAEDRLKLIDARRTREGHTREQEGYWLYGSQVAKLEAQGREGVISERQVAEGIDGINRQFAAATGVDRLYTTKEMESLLTANYRKRYQAIRAAQTASKDVGGDVAVIRENLRQGNNLVMYGMDKKLFDNVWGREAEALMNSEHPTAFVELARDTFVMGNRYVNPQMESKLNSLTAQVEGSDVHPGAAMDQLHATWVAFSEVPGAASARTAYFGQDMDVRLERYDQQVRSRNMIPEEAFGVAFKAPVRVAPRANNPEHREAVAGVIEDLDTVNPGFFKRWGGAPRLAEGHMGSLVDEVASQASLLISNTTRPRSLIYQDALEQVMSGKEILGAWMMDTPRDRPPLHQLADTTPEEASDIFMEILFEQADNAGLQIRVPEQSWSRIRASSRRAPYTSDMTVRGMAGAPGLFDAEQVEDVNILPMATAYEEDGTPYFMYNVTVATSNSPTGRMIYTIDSRDVRARAEERVKVATPKARPDPVQGTQSYLWRDYSTLPSWMDNIE